MYHKFYIEERKGTMIRQCSGNDQDLKKQAIVLLIKTGAKMKLPKHIYQGILWSAALAIWCVLQFTAHNHLVPQGHYGTGQSYDYRSD